MKMYFRLPLNSISPFKLEMRGVYNNENVLQR